MSQIHSWMRSQRNQRSCIRPYISAMEASCLTAAAWVQSKNLLGLPERTSPCKAQFCQAWISPHFSSCASEVFALAMSELPPIASMCCVGGGTREHLKEPYSVTPLVHLAKCSLLRLAAVLLHICHQRTFCSETESLIFCVQG